MSAKSTLPPGAPFLIGIVGVTIALMLFGAYLFFRSATVSPKTLLLLLVPAVGILGLYLLTRKSK
jgi:hypothetical protein